MPIKKHSKDSAGNDITLPTFSYQNDRLADLIVAAWADGPFSHGGVTVNQLGDALVGPNSRDAQGRPKQSARDAAKAAVNFFANMDLKEAVVITEKEHDDGFTMQDDDQVVFVLPNKTRIPGSVGSPPFSTELIETAKLLMACTPNGI
jgi:hypothetical protein